MIADGARHFTERLERFSMKKGYILLSAFGVLLLSMQIAAQEHTVRPAHKAVVTCYNGKIESRSNCSAANFQPDGTIFPNGGPMRCGFSGRVSLIAWSLVKKDEDGDHYEFVRVFPHGEDDAKRNKKRIRFGGKRVIIFKDEHQVVVIDPPPKIRKGKAEHAGADRLVNAPASAPEGSSTSQVESKGGSE